MPTKRFFSVLILMLLIFPACARKEEKRPAPPPIRVSAATAERGDLDQRLNVSGPLQFVANTTVSAEVSAQVKTIEVEDGQAVDEGQLLLVFDDTKIKESAIQAASTLQKNEAVLQYNKSEWERNMSLHKSGAVSDIIFEQKASAYQNSQAQVESDRSVYNKAMDDLKKTRVKSPIYGRLSKRFIEKGDWVNAGGKLFQVSDYRRIYIEGFLSDRDVAKLDIANVMKEGIGAEVVVDSYPDKTFNGRLTYIEPAAGESRLFQVRIYLDNPEMMLLQGMFARGSVVVKTLSGVLRIPLAALLDQVRNNDSNAVYIVDKDKKALLRRIKIGSSNRLFAEVKEGLKEGDLVVTKGKDVLTTGQPLETEEIQGAGLAKNAPPDEERTPGPR